VLSPHVLRLHEPQSVGHVVQLSPR
jgi:hypothetical protein